MSEVLETETRKVLVCPKCNYQVDPVSGLGYRELQHAAHTGVCPADGTRMEPRSMPHDEKVLVMKMCCKSAGCSKCAGTGMFVAGWRFATEGELVFHPFPENGKTG